MVTYKLFTEKIYYNMKSVYFVVFQHLTELKENNFPYILFGDLTKWKQPTTDSNGFETQMVGIACFLP